MRPDFCREMSPHWGVKYGATGFARGLHWNLKENHTSFTLLLSFDQQFFAAQVPTERDLERLTGADANAGLAEDTLSG